VNDCALIGAPRNQQLTLWKFDREITLPCKWLKTQGKFCGWEAGIRTRSKAFF